MLVMKSNKWVIIYYSFSTLYPAGFVVAAVFQQQFLAIPFTSVAKLDIGKSNSITYLQRSPPYLTTEQHLQDQHFH